MEPLTLEFVLALAGYIMLIGGALAVLTKWVFKPIAKVIRQLVMFFEQWFGEDPATVPPGQDPRLGVLDRLAELEARGKRTEWHVGNGNPVPLRQVVLDNAKRTAEALERLDRLDGTQVDTPSEPPHRDGT